jgi:hypothetical protein
VLDMGRFRSGDVLEKMELGRRCVTRVGLGEMLGVGFDDGKVLVAREGKGEVMESVDGVEVFYTGHWSEEKKVSYPVNGVGFLKGAVVSAGGDGSLLVKGEKVQKLEMREDGPCGLMGINSSEDLVFVTQGADDKDIPLQMDFKLKVFSFS